MTMNVFIDVILPLALLLVPFAGLLYARAKGWLK